MFSDEQECFGFQAVGQVDSAYLQAMQPGAYFSGLYGVQDFAKFVGFLLGVGVASGTAEVIERFVVVIDYRPAQGCPEVVARANLVLAAAVRGDGCRGGAPVFLLRKPPMAAANIPRAIMLRIRYSISVYS